METCPPRHPALDLSAHMHCQLVHTLTSLLPPPLDDSPEALSARNVAAIAKVAALLPANANEADLAAQCVVARAQAEDIMRLIRQHAGFIDVTMRLNAQYASMTRTSLSVLGSLLRVQAVRRKRAAIDGAANEDAWAVQIAERSMLRVVYPSAKPEQAASPEAAQETSPEAAPTAMPASAPAADLAQRIKENVSENETNSHSAAFETWLSAQLEDLAIEPPEGRRLHKVVQEAMA